LQFLEPHLFQKAFAPLFNTLLKSNINTDLT